MSLTNTMPDRHRLGLLALLALLLALAGCTSDDPNTVGLDLIDTEFEVVLEPLALEDITHFQTLPVKDEEVPLDQQELVYFGEQNGTSSSVLMNFDFSDIYADGPPAEYWTDNNIRVVNLLFSVAEPYLTYEDGEDEPPLSIPKVYDLQRLEAPFDPADYPGPEPASTGSHALVNTELFYGRDVTLEVQTLNFLNWVNSGEVEGLILRDGSAAQIQSELGLLGLASQEIAHESQFPDESVLEDVRIRLFVEFEDMLTVADGDTLTDVEGVYIYPVADISTFHEIQDVPADLADGFCVRTGLRNYPVLAFDYSALPENCYVNRAVLSVTNDISTSYGTVDAIVISEFPLDALPAAGDSITLDEIDEAVYTLTGWTGLDPNLNELIEFNVTTAVHRVINGVYEGPRGFLMTAGEDIFPGYDTSTIDPDFYLNRFNFFGTSAEEDLRPRLKISYSVIEGIDGGAE